MSKGPAPHVSARSSEVFGQMIASSGIHAADSTIAHYRSDGTVYLPASRPSHRPRLYRGSRDHIGRSSREKTYSHKSRPGARPPASPPNVGRTLPLSTSGERPRASRLVNVCEVGRVIENPSQAVKFRSSSKSGGGALLRREDVWLRSSGRRRLRGKQQPRRRSPDDGAAIV
jgi:hypothetical protein